MLTVSTAVLKKALESLPDPNTSQVDKRISITIVHGYSLSEVTQSFLKLLNHFWISMSKKSRQLWNRHLRR